MNFKVTISLICVNHQGSHHAVDLNSKEAVSCCPILVACIKISAHHAAAGPVKRVQLQSTAIHSRPRRDHATTPSSTLTPWTSRYWSFISLCTLHMPIHIKINSIINAFVLYLTYLNLFA